VQWLEELKVAIINHDFIKIEKLCDNTPDFEIEQELLEAQALINEAIRITTKQKNDSLKIMQKIKKQSAFLSTSNDDALFSLSS